MFNLLIIINCIHKIKSESQIYILIQKSTLWFIKEWWRCRWLVSLLHVQRRHQGGEACFHRVQCAWRLWSIQWKCLPLLPAVPLPYAWSQCWGSQFPWKWVFQHWSWGIFYCSLSLYDPFLNTDKLLMNHKVSPSV